MKKPYAYSLIRPEPHYRRDAFETGLAAAGYEVRQGAPGTINPGDVVLSWNRYGANHDICTKVEAAGGIALICENGYIGPGGVSPHHMEPRSIYAMARHAHNGAGELAEGGPERWDALGVSLRPWRASWEHVLVCPNRPFGMPGMAMPADWTADVCLRLRKLTKREIRVRPHPGNDAPRKPLAEDLSGAWAVVIWSSSAGVHALVAGIPVVCEAPHWICKGATFKSEPYPDMHLSARRLDALQRLAWAQWSISEIESGEPFRRLLLPDTEQVESAAAL